MVYWAIQTFYLIETVGGKSGIDLHGIVMSMLVQLSLR